MCGKAIEMIESVFELCEVMAGVIEDYRDAVRGCSSRQFVEQVVCTGTLVAGLGYVLVWPRGTFIEQLACTGKLVAIREVSEQRQTISEEAEGRPNKLGIAEQIFAEQSILPNKIRLAVLLPRTLYCRTKGSRQSDQAEQKDFGRFLRPNKVSFEELKPNKQQSS